MIRKAGRRTMLAEEYDPNEIRNAAGRLPVLHLRDGAIPGPGAVWRSRRDRLRFSKLPIRNTAFQHSSHDPHQRADRVAVNGVLRGGLLFDS
ncbi:protein of unknown function [Candidatus Filomicrobium marinum]|uniref:Uncharacterized protein n=1 Tax=Candidatus Filomicrobium marinum TaxID=1608628 RepID=A0A0D6JI80_9HYPH|nr:protein of unknown function [Candidatus Filomicrobium marinum]CPR20860.1 protein of unknown function [Candidatus Filomicrobium marinum]